MSNHELSLLRPRDASLTNSDDWPIFELKNVDVCDPTDASSSPVDLLLAGSYRPLTITGKLEPLSKKDSHLALKPSYHRSQTIEITDVKEFSYGQYENGNIDLWAAGQAGWYTVHPSRAYKEIYNDMLQSIALLYFAADSYKSVGRYGDLSEQDLFRKYQQTHADIQSSTSSVEALFGHHRFFLISSMLTGKEGLSWHKTPLLKYMQAEYPSDVDIIKQRLNFRPPRASSSRRNTQSPAPSNASIKRKRSTLGDAVPRKSRRSSQQTNSRFGTPQQAETPRRPSVAGSEQESNGPSKRGHKGKSALRPRPSKYVQPETSAVQGVDEDGVIVIGNADGPVTSPLLSMKPAAGSSMPGTSLCQFDKAGAGTVVDMDDIDEGIEMPSDDDLSDMDQAVAGAQPDLPFRETASGDVWQCPLNGCMHRVYAALEAPSKRLVQEHQQMHDDDEDDDKRLKLIRRMQAPWLPVGRLMGRVRELAAQNGSPAPIVQRY